MKSTKTSLVYPSIKNPSLAHRAGVKVEVKGQIGVDHLSSVTQYIVACQHCGVSGKPPWLQAMTRHGLLTLKMTSENSSSRNAIYGQFYLNQNGSDNLSVTRGYHSV